MTCAQLLQHLLDHSDWYGSAIELHFNQDGDKLHAEAEKAVAQERDIAALLRESKRHHYHCDDSWYCCRACRCPDHALRDGEFLGEGEDGPGDGCCTCAADAWNARVDATLGDSS